MRFFCTGFGDAFLRVGDGALFFLLMGSMGKLSSEVSEISIVSPRLALAFLVTAGALDEDALLRSAWRFLAGFSVSSEESDSTGRLLENFPARAAGFGSSESSESSSMVRKVFEAVAEREG